MRESHQTIETIDTDLSKAIERFHATLLDCTDAFELSVGNGEELSGIPDAEKAVMRQGTGSKRHPGKWCLTLDFPVASAVLRGADRQYRHHYQAPEKPAPGWSRSFGKFCG